MRIKIKVKAGKCLQSIERVVREMKKEKSKATAEISYNTPYAVRVHEDMTPKNWTTPGTGPKYLENPMRGGFNSGKWSRIFLDRMEEKSTLQAAVEAVAKELHYDSIIVCPMDSELLRKTSMVKMVWEQNP